MFVLPYRPHRLKGLHEAVSVRLLFPLSGLRSIEAMLSAEEILCSTRQVIAGLEALRVENRTLLDSLQEQLQSRPASESASLEQEKTGIVLHSLEKIELGLGEAQVSSDSSEVWQIL